MNAIKSFLDEDELANEFSSRRETALASARSGQSTSRNLTGQERIAQRSRYSRRAAPTRTNGVHRRGS